MIFKNIFNHLIMANAANWRSKSNKNLLTENWKSFKDKNYYIVTVTNVNEVLKNDIIRPQRGGVIMYGKYEDEIYFGLAKDSKTHELTDFGGGIKYKNDGNSIVGALREFNEESLKIFEEISPNEIGNVTVIYGKNDILVFLPIQNLDPIDINSRFETRYSEHSELYSKEPEVCGIVWVNYNEFWNLVFNDNSNHILYSRVKKLISNANDIKYHL